jgi:RHS repeat-associated protein
LIEIKGVKTPEGDSMKFEVSLSSPTRYTVTVDYDTADGTAVAGSDYTAGSGSLTFTPGQTKKTVSVATTDDSSQEQDESLYLQLSELSSTAQFGQQNGKGQGLIWDNDSPATVSVSKSRTIFEGATSTFIVTLSRPTQNGVAVDYETSNGTALAGSQVNNPLHDYVETIGEITFGHNEIQKAIEVPTLSSSASEKDEQFNLTLTFASGATLANTTGKMTITEDFAKYLNDNPELKKLLEPCECTCECGTEVAFSSQNLANGDNFVSAEVGRSLARGLGQAQARRASGGGDGGGLFGLVYRSSGNPHPIVAFEDVFPEGETVPDKIKVELTYGGIVAEDVWFETDGFAPGDPYRFAVQVDASTLVTGTHEYTLQIKEYVGSAFTTRTIHGRQELINDIESPFGNRWWFNGLEQLHVDDDWVMLRTDQAATTYLEDGQGGFITPHGYTATLVKNVDNSYTLSEVDGSVREFNSAGRLTERINANGNTTTYAYTDGRLTSVTDELAGITTLAYDNGLLISLTDPTGNVAEFEHDVDDRLTTIIRPDPDGAGGLPAPELTFSYDGETNLLVRSTDAAGNTKHYEYNFARRVERVIHPDGAVEEFDDRESVGLVDLGSGEGTRNNPAPLAGEDQMVGKFRDEAGNESIVTTGPFGAVESVTDATGVTRLYERDEHGRVIRIIEPQGDGLDPDDVAITLFEYDSRGNVTEITHPDNSVETFEYDETFSRLTRHDDPLGRITLFEIDEETGDLLSVTRVVGEIDDEINQETDDVTTSYTYTPPPQDPGDLPGGLLLTETDPLGRVTVYTYQDDDQSDEFGRLLSITYADGTADEATYEFEYDARGNRTAEIDPLGRRTEYEYDDLDRLTLMRLPDPDGGGGLESPEYVYTYDSMGRLMSQTDPLGNVTSYAYDARNQPVAVTLPDPDGGGPLESPLVISVYGSTGKLEAQIDPLGAVTRYEYDSRGRLWRQTLPDPDGAGALAAPVIAYTYDAAYRVATQTDALGNVASYEYDKRGRLVKVTQADPDGAGPLAAPVSTSQYDAAGQLTSQTDPLGRTTTYTYDDLGRLVNRILPDPDGVGGQSSPVYTYTYDDAGNLLTETDPLGNTTEYEYDNLYRVTTITYADPDDGGPLASPVQTYEYDDAGQLTSETDPLNRTTTYVYDDLGRQINVIGSDPDGAGGQTSPITTYTYDAVGNLLTETDALGNTTEYEYDNLSRVTTITYADPDDGGPQAAPVETYEYDAAGRLTTSTDALGRETTHEYDALGRLVTKTLPDPDGAGGQSAPEWEYEYDAMGNLLTQTDPLGNETTYEYDKLYRVTTITYADPDDGGPLAASVQKYAYDAAGQLTKAIDPLNRTTTYTYDGLGRLTKLTLPDPDGAGGQASPVYTYTYDAVGNRTSEIDPLGNTTSYGYDSLYRTTTITYADPDGGGALTAPVQKYAYDAAGQLTSATDPLNRTTTYLYDELGRQVNVIEPDPDGGGGQASPVTTYTYDSVGNLLSMTDPLGKTANYTYDNLYRQTKVQLPDPDGGGSLGRPTTTYTYDAVGNLTSLIDPVGNETTWVYDGLNRVIEETNELNDTRSFEYDAVGNLLEKTDRNERVTEYQYDNLYRLTRERWLDGATPIYTATYEYDVASQLLEAQDDFSHYTYTYDGLGRVTEIESDNGGPAVQLAQEFDTAGRRTMLSALIDVGSGFDDDFVNTYQYDNLGRLTRIEQQGVQGGNAVAEKRVDLAYNSASQYTSIKRYDDLTGGGGDLAAETAYEYDGIGRLTDLTHSLGTVTFADYEWEYDAFSRVTRMSFDSLVGDNGVSTYTYDDTNQLTGADHDFQTDESNSFDENGNRTTSGYTTGDNNQLTSDGTFDYTYDDEGNRLTRIRISNDPADDYLTEYEWDHHNRLVNVTYKDNSSDVTKEIEYTYDIFGRRIKKSIDADGAGAGDAVGVEYVYDAGWDIQLAFDGDSSLTNRYLHGPGEDNILADEQFTPSSAAEMPTAIGDLFWMLTDNLGSVRDVVDGDGSNVVNHIVYDSFGRVVDESAPGFSTISGFQGAERDEETGMQLHDRRYLDVVVGGWISFDPIGFEAGDWNLRRFVGNGPTNATDPTGLKVYLIGRWVIGDHYHYAIVAISEDGKTVVTYDGGGRSYPHDTKDRPIPQRNFTRTAVCLEKYWDKTTGKYVIKADPGTYVYEVVSPRGWTFDEEVRSLEYAFQEGVHQLKYSILNDLTSNTYTHVLLDLAGLKVKPYTRLAFPRSGSPKPSTGLLSRPKPYTIVTSEPEGATGWDYTKTDYRLLTFPLKCPDDFRPSKDELSKSEGPKFQVPK